MTDRDSLVSYILPRALLNYFCTLNNMNEWNNNGANKCMSGNAVRCKPVSVVLLLFSTNERVDGDIYIRAN